MRILVIAFCRCFLPAVLFSSALPEKALSQATLIHYLSGTDKDHTVPWQFYCSKGMNSGKWTTIAVPSNWEQQGFGGYSYGHDKVKTDEQGMYKYSFNANPAWMHKKIFIVFQGSMTDTDVKINGVSAGPVHQGGFTEFKYDITDLLRAGLSNELEVTVYKMSAEASVNRAERNGDFWTLGGIYRPVYLEIVPETFISRVAIDAKADGMFHIDIFTGNSHPGDIISARVESLDGRPAGPATRMTVMESREPYKLEQQIRQPKLWNPESPNLYQVNVSIKNKAGITHSMVKKFGFRTAVLRLNDGFYVNGKKVLFKGVCRHSEWPETGRTLSRDISLMDVKLMKEMNMNAVRMSHYPPDDHFLETCDSLGIFVLDELTGWQAAYDTIAGRKLLKELVVRDVNHPSVVIWDNGNEGGWNRALDGDYALYDPQHRLVIHPWEKFNGTDTKHYPDYNYVVNSALYGEEIFFPTEFMHGLYDGGLGAGLEDFWNLMVRHPRGAGGFLWAFHDEGIVRRDKRDSIDTDGNHAPDGILGPHREKEASYYTIKELWSPVYLAHQPLADSFSGRLPVENRYLFSNFDQCSFVWKIMQLPTADGRVSRRLLAGGSAPAPHLEPGEKGFLNLHLPRGFRNGDVLMLTARDKQKKEICSWSWPLKSPASVLKENFGGKALPMQEVVQAKLNDSIFSVHHDGVTYYFNSVSGCLEKVVNSQSEEFLLNGPLPGGALNTCRYYREADTGFVECVYKGDSKLAVQWKFAPGQPAVMNYNYVQRVPAEFAGISFHLPDSAMGIVKMMAEGPYRVWKNRLRGQQFGVWSKPFNNAITGESWLYPEFKGYYAAFYWAEIGAPAKTFRLFNETPGVFLQLGRPGRALAVTNDNVNPPFPAGNIGLMNSIPAIGTKFQPAERMGPQSQLNVQLNAPFYGKLTFDFNPSSK